MTRLRRARCASIALAASLAVLSSAATVLVGADSIPGRLTDSEFWQLVTDLSEPDGAFRSDNLLSNELRLQAVIPGLMRTIRPGRVYMGVGPEQNFTYIAALKPSMAFIVDIRRGNLDLHLMYKALFELSADRNEFVSRLFSRPRAEGIDETSSSSDIFDAYAQIAPNSMLFDENLQAVRRQLSSNHHLALPESDLTGIAYVYQAFLRYGPRLRYSSNGGNGGAGGRGQPTYADLMVATDYSGQPRGFLASEQAFKVVKDLESRNMIVPVVGNFGGDKAVRAVGSYVRSRGATVAAFYVSNVEQYLRQDRLWETFCANVATLPLDSTSTFIRAVFGRGSGSSFISELGPIASEVEMCHAQ
jgi:hypothetical protein